jgi:hypothetical protein
LLGSLALGLGIFTLLGFTLASAAGGGGGGGNSAGGAGLSGSRRLHSSSNQATSAVYIFSKDEGAGEGVDAVADEVVTQRVGSRR